MLAVDQRKPAAFLPTGDCADKGFVWLPVGVAMLDPSSGLRRAPWRGGKGGRAALKAFALTALPFVLLEAATGVVSLATGLPSIPPMLGIGTAVDSAILVAGLAVALYGGVKARPPDSRTSDR